jgi:hypothetical protein
MFCNYCGAPNPDVASFCHKCGKLIERPSAVPVAVPVAAAPAGTQPISSVMDVTPSATPSATLSPSASAPSGAPQAVAPSPAARGTSFAVSEALSAAGRAQFTDGLTAEVRRQIDNKCIPVGIAAWIITMIAVARFSIPEFGQGWGLGICIVMAFVVAGIVTKIMHVFLEDKYLRPLADLSDEMLVNRYNEAKADRRAARTRTAISWAVIAIIVVLLLIAWVAAQRN